MKVVKGNCLLARKHLQPQSVDCIITSPPYNIGKKYNTYLDKLPREEYLDFMERVAKVFQRILKKNGHLFLNVGVYKQRTLDRYRCCTAF